MPFPNATKAGDCLTGQFCVLDLECEVTRCSTVLLLLYILEFKIDQYQLRFAKHNVIFVCNEKY